MPKIAKARGRSALIGLVLVLLMAIMACGPAATPAVVERQVVITPTPGPKQTIVFSDLKESLFASLKGAYARRDPWLGYSWAPPGLPWNWTWPCWEEPTVSKSKSPKVVVPIKLHRC